MTDEQLVSYALIHSETDLHLFAKEHANRLLVLAGRPQMREPAPAFVGIDRRVCRNLVEAIRGRSE